MDIKVYYFADTFDEFDKVLGFSKDECEWYGANHSEVSVYSLAEFEMVFNADFLDYKGFIRIF